MISQTMQVSVILPFFNRVDMLKQAIESVLEQTWQPLEFIVIDDGSSDTIPWEDFSKKVKTFSTPHQGVSAARNFGVSKAQGNWISFLDSDDLWHPTKLAKQIQFHQRNPEFSISQSTEIWIRNGKRVNPSFKYQKKQGDLFVDSLGQCAVTPSTVMMRKDIFEKYGPFDTDLMACEDYDLWLKITAKEQVGLIEEPLMTRNGGHSDQLSFKYPAMDRFRVYSMMKLLLTTPLSAEQEVQAKEVLQEKFRVLELGAVKRGRDLSQVAAGIQEIIRSKAPPSMHASMLEEARLYLLNEWQ